MNVVELSNLDSAIRFQDAAKAVQRMAEEGAIPLNLAPPLTAWMYRAADALLVGKQVTQEERVFAGAVLREATT